MDVFRDALVDLQTPKNASNCRINNTTQKETTNEVRKYISGL